MMPMTSEGERNLVFIPQDSDMQPAIRGRGRGGAGRGGLGLQRHGPKAR